MKIDPSKDIPTAASKSEDWIEWHKELISNLGATQANALFLKAWRLRGSQSANTLDLRTYLKDNGITISESAWDKAVDVGAGAFGSISDIFKMGKYASIAIGVIIIGGLAVAVYNVAKNPVASAKSGAKLLV